MVSRFKFPNQRVGSFDFHFSVIRSVRSDSPDTNLIRMASHLQDYFESWSPSGIIDLYWYHESRYIKRQDGMTIPRSWTVWCRRYFFKNSVMMIRKGDERNMFYSWNFVQHSWFGGHMVSQECLAHPSPWNRQRIGWFLDEAAILCFWENKVIDHVEAQSITTLENSTSANVWLICIKHYIHMYTFILDKTIFNRPRLLHVNSFFPSVRAQLWLELAHIASCSMRFFNRKTTRGEATHWRWHWGWWTY